jgi:hypothetical protein
MKSTLYFFDEQRCAVITLSPEGIEPAHIAKFELREGQSSFTPRYSLVNGQLIDNYSGKSDDEVAVILQQLETQKAAELAAKLTPKVHEQAA